MSIYCVNEAGDEKHFIFICPQHADLRESIRAIGKAENITKDTVLLHFLMNLVSYVSSAFERRGV